jgi:hypothetical protein
LAIFSNSQAENQPFSLRSKNLLSLGPEVKFFPVFQASSKLSGCADTLQETKKAHILICPTSEISVKVER